jgi:hypothetical protein
MIAYVKNVVAANKTPPHKVSMKTVLAFHFLNIVMVVPSKTPLMTIPSKNASFQLLWENKIK